MDTYGAVGTVAYNFGYLLSYRYCSV